MEHMILRGIKRAGITALIAALTLALTGCAPAEEEGGVRYVKDEKTDEVIVEGYDATYLVYNPSRGPGIEPFLYIAGPWFLGGFFADAPIEGDATMEGDTITVAFTRADDPNSGTVWGAGANFTVDLKSNTVVEYEFVPWEGHTIDLTEEEMLHAAQELGAIYRAAEAYVAEQDS